MVGFVSVFFAHCYFIKYRAKKEYTQVASQDILSLEVMHEQTDTCEQSVALTILAIMDN